MLDYQTEYFATQPNCSILEPEVKSPSHGSYHWNAERALSLISLPLMGTAVIYGSIPTVDIALGIVLPLHIHLGFDCIIQDYFPERRSKVRKMRIISLSLSLVLLVSNFTNLLQYLNLLFTWLLRLGTVLTFYGCYVINSKDVGLTALTARLWTGKVPSEEKSKK